MQIKRALICALTMALILVWANPGQAKETRIIRVGIIAYQNFESTYARYQKLFAALAKVHPDYDVTFSMAVGTYGEVMDWYGKNLIDVAVLTPGPVAELLDLPDAASINDSYVATHLLEPAIDPILAQDDRIKGTLQFQYRAVGIVSQSTCNDKSADRLCDYADLARLAKAGRIKFLFVHPLSVSGFILPSYILRHNNININNNTIEWTYGQDKSLQRVSSPPEEDNKIKVAFVWDGVEADYCHDSFKKIVMPPLTPGSNIFLNIENYLIPQEVVFLNTSLRNQKYDQKQSKYANKFDEYKALLVDLLTKGNPSTELRFAVDNKWKDGFMAVKEWVKEIKPTINQRTLYGTNLNDLVKILKSYKEHNPGEPIRLALVLSGGGAKCSYQLGAIEAIESKLKELRDKGDQDMDIGLVVGTSGGAINALTVAMGLTKDKPGREALRDTWVKFDQWTFFQPWPSVSLFYGVFWAVIQTIFFLALVLAVPLLFRRTNKMWWGRSAVIIFSFGVIEFLISRYFIWSPWNAASKVWMADILQHLWLLIMLISYWSAPWLLIIGILNFVMGWIIIGKRQPSFRTRRKLFLFLFVELAVGLIMLGYLVYAGYKALRGWEAGQGWPAIIAAFILLLCIAVTILLLYLLRDRIGKRIWINIAVASMITIMVNGVVIAGLTLRYEISLSAATGMESALAKNIPALIGPGFQTNQNQSYNEQLQDMSRWIMGNHKLQRDLVITASRLPTQDDMSKALPSEQLPSDLYFYFANHSNSFLLDRRFVSFDNPNNRSLLLDVVIGSSSIYPVFPPRHLQKVSFRHIPLLPEEPKRISVVSSVMEEPDQIEERDKKYDMDIIDGGYIHNSPIDAALRWRPTHIILIEASPLESPTEPRNFMDSSATAFNYLFNQAQRVDTQLKGKFVEIFELRPLRTCTGNPAEDPSTCTPEPNLDTFDFSPNRVMRAIQRGFSEASSNEAHFIRLPGQPQFKDVSDIITETLHYKVYCIDGRTRISTQSLDEIKQQLGKPVKAYQLGMKDSLEDAMRFAIDNYGGIDVPCRVCQPE